MQEITVQNRTISIEETFTRINVVASKFQGFERILLEFKKWSNEKPTINVCAYCKDFNISTEGQSTQEVIRKLQKQYEFKLIELEERFEVQELVFA